METVTTKIHDFIRNPTMLKFIIALWPIDKKVVFDPHQAFEVMQDSFFHFENLDHTKTRLEVQMAIVECVNENFVSNAQESVRMMLQRMYDRLREDNTNSLNQDLYRWFFQKVESPTYL